MFTVPFAAIFVTFVTMHICDDNDVCVSTKCITGEIGKLMLINEETWLCCKDTCIPYNETFTDQGDLLQVDSPSNATAEEGFIVNTTTLNIPTPPSPGTEDTELPLLGPPPGSDCLHNVAMLLVVLLWVYIWQPRGGGGDGGGGDEGEYQDINRGHLRSGTLYLKQEAACGYDG